MKLYVYKIILKIFRLTGLLSLLPDKLFLKMYYLIMTKNELDLIHPKTFGEKLQWLKLYDRNPEYTSMVDKFAAKEFVTQKIGSEYIIPTLGIWDKFENIDFSSLPNQFVLKCTHDSGGIVICSDKSKFNLENSKKIFEKSLRKNYFYNGREWPYKNVQRRIIAEKYMGDNLQDYKFYCFGGVPKMILVCSNRFKEGGLKQDYFDERWNHLNVQMGNHDNSSFPINKPKQLDLMKNLAIQLSVNIPFVRIDFYEIDGKVYFGEITFYPSSGFELFSPLEWNLKAGDWIKIPLRK